MRISATVSAFALALHLGGVAALGPRQEASDEKETPTFIAKSFIIEYAPVSARCAWLLPEENLPKGCSPQLTLTVFLTLGFQRSRSSSKCRLHRRHHRRQGVRQQRLLRCQHRD